MNAHKKFKKILFILYQFPPSNDVGTQRPIRFIRNLGRFGWKAVVLAPYNGVYNSYDAESAAGILDACTVYRTPMFFPSGRFNRASRLFPDAWAASLWRVWNRLALPDGALAWLMPAVAKGIKIARQHEVDVLFASGQPFSTFVVASLVKRATAKPLLLDYRDPWTLNPFHKGSRLRKMSETQIEKFALRTADAAIFTTAEARASQQCRFVRPDPARFYQTISNSYEKNREPDARPGVAGDRFRLVHAGNLYGTRNPDHLFEAAALAARDNSDFSARTRLVFFGVFSAARYKTLACNLGIGHMVEFGKRLTRAELDRQYRKAGALLLINSYGDGHQVFIPSKFFEYLEIGLPIFCLAEAGALKTAVDRTRAGMVVDPQKPREIAEGLLSFFNRFYVQCEDYRPDQDEIDRYEASHTTRQLVRLCEDLARRQPQYGANVEGKPEWKI